MICLSEICLKRVHFGVTNTSTSDVQVIVVAAGRGQRMGEATANKPKCLLEFQGKTLLEWQLAALSAVGLRKVTVVGGYKADQIPTSGLELIHNPDWATSNMVYSLMCAERVFNCGTDVIVAYSDIIYSPSLLTKLLEVRADISTAVDKNWLALWKMRFDNPLDDAETMRISGDGRISDIGRKPTDLASIQGQFVGLTRFTEEGARKFSDAYRSLKGWNSDIDPRNCYFTDVLRALVSRNVPVMGALTHGGWLEFDSAADLKLYQDLASTNHLDQFWSRSERRKA